MERQNLPQSAFKPCPNANSKVLSQLWPDFVNAKKRLETYGPFFLEHLKRRGCKSVLLGAGAEIEVVEWMQRNGFSPSLNELDSEFRARAASAAAARGARLEITSHYWQEFSQHFRKGQFDAIVIDGNSLCCEPDPAGRRASVGEFRKILPEKGVLIIDQRNFDYVLSERDAILSGDFKYSGNFVYCGDKVHGTPVEISDSSTLWEYSSVSGGEKGYVTMYPIAAGKLPGIIFTSGFRSVQWFSDFRPGYDPGADFYFFVAEK